METEQKLGQREPQVIEHKPGFRDNFRATGIAMGEVLPRETYIRAMIRPIAIRFSGQLIELDTLKREEIHTVVIDLEGRTIAYCGKRNVHDEVNGMVSERYRDLKPRTLHRFADVVGEINTSLERSNASRSN